MAVGMARNLALGRPSAENGFEEHAHDARQVLAVTGKDRVPVREPAPRRIDLGQLAEQAGSLGAAA
jgi:hypothetical protein